MQPFQSTGPQCRCLRFQLGAWRRGYFLAAMCAVKRVSYQNPEPGERIRRCTGPAPTRKAGASAACGREELVGFGARKSAAWAQRYEQRVHAALRFTLLSHYIGLQRRSTPIPPRPGPSCRRSRLGLRYPLAHAVTAFQCGNGGCWQGPHCCTHTTTPSPQLRKEWHPLQACIAGPALQPATTTPSAAVWRAGWSGADKGGSSESRALPGGSARTCALGWAPASLPRFSPPRQPAERGHAFTALSTTMSISVRRTQFSLLTPYSILGAHRRPPSPGSTQRLEPHEPPMANGSEIMEQGHGRGTGLHHEFTVHTKSFLSSATTARRLLATTKLRTPPHRGIQEVTRRARDEMHCGIDGKWRCTPYWNNAGHQHVLRISRNIAETNDVHP